MKKLLLLLAFIPTLLFGQTPPIYNVLGAGNNANSRSLIGLSLISLRGASSGTVAVNGPSVITTYTFTLPANDGTSGQYLQTDGNGVTSWQTISTDLTVGTTVINSGTTGRILYDNAGVLGEYSAIPIAFGGTNNTSAYTAGSVIFSNGTSLTQDNSNFFWDDGNNRLGIGIATPTATIHGKGAGSDSSTSLFYGVAANGRNILGVQNGGSVGINCLAGQAGVVNGAISDCALEVCSRTNEANNSFIFAAKSYSATQTYFRIRSNSQPGYIGEFYQGWKHFGNMGFNINPDSTRQVQVKGWNASASWYPFIVTNGSNTNLFNLEADGHTNLFGYLTTNRLATNASIATVTGGMAINTVKTTIAASGDGSSALRICGTDAFAAGNGGFISLEAVYDASNKYGMATIAGIKENGTSGNSAGALVLSTHTSGVGSMTEAMRLTSDQNAGIGTTTPSARLEVVSTTTVALEVDGRFETKQGTDIASSSTITITYTGNIFELTGTTAVDFITTTGWQEGSELVLIANESVTINDDAGGGNIRLAGNANFAMTGDDVLTLIYSSTTAGGAIWREKSRSAN